VAVLITKHDIRQLHLRHKAVIYFDLYIQTLKKLQNYRQKKRKPSAGCQRTADVLRCPNIAMCWDTEWCRAQLCLVWKCHGMSERECAWRPATALSSDVPCTSEVRSTYRQHLRCRRPLPVQHRASANLPSRAFCCNKKDQTVYLAAVPFGFNGPFSTVKLHCS